MVVTVQYRLGALGFLGSSELRNRDFLGSSGNYGMQDQRLALQWIQEYASSFGGDPNRVVIFGQSAGAGSVNFHLVAKASHGLFHAAVMQSGACAPWASQSWHDSEATFTAIRLVVNCSNMTCLLEKSAQELAIAAIDVGTRGFGFAPTEDGIDLDRPICAKMERGEFSKVPLMVGFNRDESSPPSSARMTEADFDETISSQVPLHLRAEVKAKYTERYSEWYWAAQHFIADVDFNCPAQRFARAAESFGATVFAYKFSRQPNFNIELMMGSDAAPSELWGAFHGAELPFVFGNPRVKTWRINLSEADQQLARRISEHWVTMATTGRPASTWPAYTSKSSPSRQWLLLDSPSVSVHESELFPQCSVIDSLGPSPQTPANTSIFGRFFSEYGVAHIRGRAANHQRPPPETNSRSA
jgi:para-nitrobenzyl esterase